MQKKMIIVTILVVTTATALAWATMPEKKPAAIAPGTLPKTVAPRQVKIKANIKPDELGYKKFFSTYYPDTLKIRANGKEVYALTNKDKVESKEISIPVDGNKLTIEYEYEWDMITGKRTGTKQVEFDLTNKVDKLELEFGSWKEENRILIPQATQVGVEQKIK